MVDTAESDPTNRSFAKNVRSDGLGSGTLRLRTFSMADGLPSKIVVLPSTIRSWPVMKPA